MDVIEEMRRDIDRLRKALKPFAEAASEIDEGEHGHPRTDHPVQYLKFTVGDLFDSRKALRESERS